MNLLTLFYWFNLNPEPFLYQYIKIIYTVIILMLIGGFISWFFIKKNKKNIIIQKFWQKIQNFCFTMGITGGILIFCRQQRIYFLSMPFLLLLLFIAAIIWIYFITKYVIKTIPEKRKEQKEKRMKEKYL